MSLPSQGTGAHGGGLEDDDLCRLIDAFGRSGRGRLDLRLGATRLRLRRRRPDAAADAAAGTPATVVTAPAVGWFMADARAGETVEAGAPLGRIRSVRAETEVIAPRTGTIAGPHAADGDFVAYGASLFDLHPQPATGGQGAQ